MYNRETMHRILDLYLCGKVPRLDMSLQIDHSLLKLKRYNGSLVFLLAASVAFLQHHFYSLHEMQVANESHWFISRSSDKKRTRLYFNFQTLS